MSRCSFNAAVGLALASASILTAAAADYRPPRKDLGFPIYTNLPPGRQVGGQHAPASTPALSPEAAQARFTTPEGFEVRLFASEPEVVNPVAMTWDERGRLWVVELYEYPMGAKEGQQPRDRIKILEDTDGDGRADQVHVWADGLNLATGILLGNGGAYVGAAPHLYFMQDTTGDDRADKSTVQLAGFGLQDRHELLNGFAWGPDGQLYMTHGVFTRSEVVDPADPRSEPVVLTAGLARFDPRRQRFEVFAEGTSNPWGVDFDRYGNAYVSACVIEHLFHLAPGGIYDRQAGSEPHPFAYQRLPSINDHRHHMAAYAGVQVYQGDQYPDDNLGSILQGNIHDHAVHQDVLRANGSSFTASAWRDLVRANDGWFMPVSVQVGPDGAVWIMDWYDRYPCYQNANADPDGVDREHGRIWRVVYTGSERGKPVPSRPQRDMDLGRLSTAELVRLLEHPNVWHRRTAQRLLSERRDTAMVAPLRTLFRTGGPVPASRRLDARLAAFWTLSASDTLAEDLLAAAIGDAEPAVRTWAARYIGERQLASPRHLAALTRLASDPDPSVRLAVAVACRQFTSGQLTVNRPPATPEVDVGPILAALVAASANGADPVLPFMLWHAGEPRLAHEPAPALAWLAEHGPRHRPLTDSLASKAMRRLCDLGDPPSIDLALTFLERVLAASPPMAAAALEGLLQGQQARALPPSRPVAPFIASLTAHADARVAALGQRLGARWGDPTALRAVRTTLANPSAPADARVQAIRTARFDRSEATRNALLDLLASPAPEAVQIEAVAALGELGGDAIADQLLDRWPRLSPAGRRAAAAAFATRPRWAMPLLARVRTGAISASDFGAPTLRALLQNRDASVRSEARAAIGRFRESPADKARLVAEKRAVVLDGVPDLAAGREVTRQTCLVCHPFLGEGADIGPDLTGVGRASLDALLWNIIDPNQVIGSGYEQVEIETRDDRVLGGRLVEDTEARVRLLLQGPREEIIARADIVSQRTLETSVMPEGLEQMSDSDFRNMVWYILAPPEEGPLTPEKRDALIGR